MFGFVTLELAINELDCASFIYLSVYLFNKLITYTILIKLNKKNEQKVMSVKIATLEAVKKTLNEKASGVRTFIIYCFYFLVELFVFLL